MIITFWWAKALDKGARGAEALAAEALARECNK